ncbi:MAG: metallophosphoesterase family protein [Desulfobacteraceae bacterium]|nr:metallophosphoesterase family protein [Desulfobacteraceae bacterium]
MRLAVVSDIHSNLEALEAVLRDASARGVGRIVSLGDNIGYGADPEAVVRLLRQQKIDSVIGNHELALMDPECLKVFNPHARQALLINKGLLSKKSLGYIRGSKVFMVRRGCLFVHGLPPDSVTTYLSLTTKKRLGHIMAAMDQPIAFVGHTHQLEVVRLDRDGVTRSKIEKKVLFLDKGSRYIINAGSVGQPRKSSLDAKYLIFDPDLYSVEPRYVDYDRASAAKKIKKAGISDEFARRLVQPSNQERSL